MTLISIKRHRGHIVSVECDGHTGYGIEGEDIVCAGVSSIVQTAVLGLMQAAGIAVSLQRDEKCGYLMCELPRELDPQMRRDADMILESMLLGIADLHEGYSDFIELEVN